MSILMIYQRQIIAYHGCLVDRYEAALLKGEHLRPSEEPFDWLGKGIYFWEQGPRRAREWAEAKARRANKPPEDARVLGAIIQLGICLDFLDTEATSILPTAWQSIEAKYADEPVPENQPARDGHDVLLRYRDCLVVNAAVRMIEKGEVVVQTVRGCFFEGGPAFPGGEIQRKAHIQIAVRDPRCIVGYFVPRREETA